MSKRILAFMVALMSFMMFIPVYADGPSDEEVRRFQDKFTVELEKAMSVLEQNHTIGYHLPQQGDVAVVGDLHGDYQVLTKIIEEVEPRLMDGSISKVVFLGDYMDRGNNSALTLYSLLKFYNEYPDCVIILRGNHETMLVSSQSWLRDPYFRDLDQEMFKRFFNALPIIVFINGYTLAVHGGIPAQYLWGAFAEGLLSNRKPSERMEYLKPGEDLFSDAVYSMLWSDVVKDRRCEGALTPRGMWQDQRCMYYGPTSWEGFVKFMKEKTRDTVYHKFFEKLSYLVRGHQPFYIEGDFIKYIPFYQIGDKDEITTVFSALENQGEPINGAGAKVAIVPKEPGPPREWLTIKFEKPSQKTEAGGGSNLSLGARRM